jgi:hypothetical protein
VLLNRYCLHLLVGFSICLLSTVNTANSSAKRTSNESATKVDSTEHPQRQRVLTVSDWFGRYDQIRRDAEMTMGDKWQWFFLLDKRPNKKNAALGTRMLKKYTIALSQMNELGSTPETKELQMRYIEYFITARQLFSNYVAAQKEVPFTNQALAPSRKKLEELDKKNKQLDEELRKKYMIAKHKHS